MMPHFLKKEKKERKKGLISLTMASLLLAWTSSYFSAANPYFRFFYLNKLYLKVFHGIINLYMHLTPALGILVLSCIQLGHPYQ